MILNPTISEVAAQSTQISTGTNGNFSTPYINSRSANTVVVTPSGQTVVIGGLMQDSKSVTHSQIPVLGDIPLLGALFRHEEKADDKTELMIFVTPYVINTPDDLARMSVDEASRAQLSTGAFTPVIRNNYIDPNAPGVQGSVPAEVGQPMDMRPVIRTPAPAPLIEAPPPAPTESAPAPGAGE
jgi:general secretion pathway protein D